VRFSVLGPLQVVTDRAVEVRGPQVGRLLAALLIDAGRVVTVDRLTDIIFAGQPTDAAATTLRSYVGRVRRLLVDDGTGVAVVTSRPGYRLELGTSTVDAHEFEAHLKAARRHLSEGDPADALTEVDAGLVLWRGPAYAEHADEEWAHLEALRLDELRVEATELRLRALTAGGRHDAAIADLARFVEEHPLREAAWSALVLALYRAGRQTEALRAAARFRTTLGQAGLEPSGTFVTLERRVAQRDPALDVLAAVARKLRGYRVVDKLPPGRFGPVSIVAQPGVEREVVLRTFPAMTADHPDFIRRFPTLVQQVARIDHPHVVRVYDFWREPGAAHLVTHYVRGGSAEAMIVKGPAPVERVTAMVEHVAGALDAAHRVGLAHRALDAGEVLFDDDGNAYVDGIGVAAMLAGVDDAGSEPGAATDQRDLAVLAHRALTGTSAVGSGFKVSTTRPELLALDGVFARATAADPADRYPDIVAFARSFLRAVGRSTAPARRAIANPYKGLRAFTAADAGEFFGRDDAVAELVARLAHGRFITVVGASGSGKSSVVRAGLVPRLRAGAVAGSERWFVATMTPGRDPFAAWDDAFQLIAAGSAGAALDSARHGIASSLRRAVPGGGDVLVVIDQLEELFTLVDDETVRLAFIESLTAALEDGGCPLRVVATLRADLYDRPLHHHRLGRLVARGAVPLVGMSAAELEQTIVGPAERAGVAVDGQLVAELVAAVADRPGSLPLLEFTLTELFDHRTSDRMTVDDYRRIGGLTAAIGARAEQVYRSLAAPTRQAARLLFLRLVTVGGNQPDLRRRTARSELASVPALGVVADELLERFGQARLLTLDRDPATREPTVEVAHEALLRSWPRLAGWITDEGHGLQLRGDLSVAAGIWASGGRHPADLYRAARLVAIEQWAADHPDDLTTREQEYLDASIAMRDGERDAERAQLDRQRSANRRLRAAVVAIGVTLVAALVLGLVAVRQRDRAVDEQAAAEQARGRALATSATASVSSDRSLALLLAVEASRLDDSPVTHQALLASLGGDGPFTRTLVPTPAIDYLALAVSGEARIAAAKRDDGSVDVIDLQQRTALHTDLEGVPTPGSGVAVDPAGTLVAAAGLAADDGTAVIVHDIERGVEVARLGGEPGGVHEVRFTPDGRTLAVGGPGGRIELYDVTDWSLDATLGIGDDRAIISFEVTPDGGRIIAAATPVAGLEPTGSARLYLLDIATGDVLAGPVETDEVFINSLAIHDASGTFAAAGDRILRYELDTLQPVGEPFGGGHDFPLGLSSVAITDDGLLAGAGGVTMQVFELDGNIATPLPVAAPAAAVAFLDGGRSMITADFDGSIWTWTTGWIDDLGEPLRPEGPGHVTLSPDGSTLAVWGASRGVLLFDTADLALHDVLPLEGDVILAGVDFHPNGRRVATLSCPAATYGPDGSCPATLTVWNSDTATVLAGPVEAGPVWAWMTLGVAYTGDGEVLAVAGFDGEVQLREASTLQPTGPALRFDDVTALAGSQARIVDAALVDDRSLVVAKGEFGQAIVFDVTGGNAEPVGVMGGNISDVGFIDGRLIAAQGSGTFQLRDPATLELTGAPFVTDVPSFWFSASDTGLLVSSSRESGAQLWDVQSRQRVSGVLASTSAALAPDGTVVYLGGLGAEGEEAGGIVRALSLDQDHLLAEACARAGRNLTGVEWERYLPSGEPYRATCDRWTAGATP
jgi:DNA-binding SARP family transcriptional activator/WD40 repeat protein